MSDKLIGSVFLSTLSLRRATSLNQLYIDRTAISIHALLAESDLPTSKTHRNWQISIHALLAESDVVGASQGAYFGHISIHALLAESDATLHDIFKLFANFYPRSPCGERHPKMSDHPHNIRFLSTLSLRRATLWVL